MKRYLLLWSMVFAFVLLAGCAVNRSPILNSNVTDENWMQAVDHSPNPWARGADIWFMRGLATPLELENQHASYEAVISTMRIQVPGFTNVRINGDFQVQIFGTDGANSVSIRGPNAGVRGLAVVVRGNTLCIDQLPDANVSVRHVIVRIGVNQLNNLVKLGGRATIEGIRLHSKALNVVMGPLAMGNMYLAGDVLLQKVTNLGYGTINIFGARSTCLRILTSGRGCVNVSGCLSIGSIIHHGVNDINILGAQRGPGTKIVADGVGKVSINGHINITEIRAMDNTCVYAYPLSTNYIYVYGYQNARIGLAGFATDLFVETFGSSRFAGRYLCAQNAYVRAHDRSHINTTAVHKSFASATERGSVYFFGSTDILAPFISGHGVVMPFSNRGSSCLVTNRALQHDYKGEAIPTRRVSYSYIEMPHDKVEAPTRYPAESNRPIAVNNGRHTIGNEVPYQSRYVWKNKKLTATN